MSDVNGHFITLEGGEGAGKTSVLKMLQAPLTNLGYDVLVTREPGGITISEEIRSIILKTRAGKMDGRTEALLYAAARRQHLVEKVLPALNGGKVVLCDRFVDSSLAYQGFARNIGIEAVKQINQFAIEDCMPDLTIFLDIIPEKGLERISQNSNREKNRLDLEKRQFHEDVYTAYQGLIKEYPHRIQPVNADQPLHQVTLEVLDVIQTYLHQKNV